MPGGTTTQPDARGALTTKVKEIKEGQEVRGFFAVRSKDLPRDYKNKSGRWFTVRVGDATGDIGLKFWGGEDPERTMRTYGSFSVGSVVYVKAMAAYDKFEDGIMLIVNEGTDELRHVEEGTMDLDLVPALDGDRIKALTDELFELIASVRDVQLKMLLQSFFSEKPLLEAFKYSPSAMRHHHAYVGGNLEHTINVARMVDLMAHRYPRIDRDLAVTGALLHDIGKLKEYQVTASVEMTSEGQFIGHLQLGWEMVRQRLERIPAFPEERRLKLWDMIIHHHGSYDRSGDMSSNLHTIESCALHYADDADAKVGGFSQFLEQAEGTKDDWVFIKELGFSIYTR